MIQTWKICASLAICTFIGCTTDTAGGVDHTQIQRTQSIPPRPGDRHSVRLPPRISRWMATSKIDFRPDEKEIGLYLFAIESPEPMTPDQQVYIQSYFRNRATEAFAKKNSLETGQVIVTVVSEKFEAKRYRGEVTAYGVNDMLLAYDSDTRKGTLSMKIVNGDFERTRKLIREHIETIVRDKNIRLVEGVTPPPGRYYLLSEFVKPGNVLQIEFKSE